VSQCILAGRPPRRGAAARRRWRPAWHVGRPAAGGRRRSAPGSHGLWQAIRPRPLRYGGRPASMTAPAWPEYHLPVDRVGGHQAPPGQALRLPTLPAGAAPARDHPRGSRGAASSPAAGWAATGMWWRGRWPSPTSWGISGSTLADPSSSTPQRESTSVTAPPASPPTERKSRPTPSRPRSSCPNASSSNWHRATHPRKARTASCRRLSGQRGRHGLPSHQPRHHNVSRTA
jgi:hypothetical protein